LPNEKGFGVEGMRARIKQLRGKMKIKSSNGTTIQLKIPLDNNIYPEVQFD